MGSKEEIGGVELVANGTFVSDPNVEWTDTTSATLDNPGGMLEITNETSTNHGQAIQEITTVPGTTYKVTGYVLFDEGTAVDLQFKIGETSGQSEYYNSGDILSNTTITQYITATGTSIFITLQNSGDGGTTGFFDNISVRAQAVNLYAGTDNGIITIADSEV